MWDVKFLLNEILKQAIIRFTLTMWDVKMINSALVPFVNIVLP